MKPTLNPIHIAMAVSAMAMVACSADEENLPGGAAGSKTTIVAEICETPQSRSAIDPTEYLGGDVGILWTPSDCIGVYGTSTQNAKFENQLEANAGKASFTGAMATDDRPTYAYYPYGTENAGRQATDLLGSLSLRQEYDPSTRVIDGDYKVGIPSELANDQFTFSHIFSLFRIRVNATGTGLEKHKLDKISLSVNNGRVLGGDFTFDATDATKAPVFPAAAEGSDPSTITMVYTGSDATLSAGTTCEGYISCAPAIRADDEITIRVYSESHVATFTRHAAYDFAANTVYTFDLTLSEFASDMTVEPRPDVEPEEETSNCYMINTAGEHSFKATVIGNGRKGIIAGAGFHTDDASINPASAALLWEDTQNFIGKVELRDGRVYYTANSNEGNAVIAVYSGANCTGDILWSWHIWGTGDTLPSDEELTNQAGATFTVMDRNLGATKMPSSASMLYQWGRKDPVPNAVVYYVNGGAADIEKSYPVVSDDAASIETGIRNPGSLVYCPSGNSDWLLEHNKSLWGDSNINDQYTWYSTGKYTNPEAGAGWTDQKTIYDPSPVGYRVANKFTFTGFVKNTDGTTPQGNSTPKLEYINYVKYENGWYFKRNSSDTEGIYFPMSGSRGAMTGSLWVGGNSPYSTLDYSASYWSSACQKNLTASQTLSLAPYSTTNSPAGYNSYNAVNTTDFSYRMNAFAVRCVRE